ncbi:MAG: alpha-1,4-glucan--maltose-1-phosphate maltosyltransferase [Desertimonas sp.]
MRLPSQRPSRVVVEPVAPVVDGGDFPAKATIGEPVTVVADVFADGHDRVAAALAVRTGRRRWRELPMTPLGNDRYAATFTPDRLGRWELQVHGWVDHLGTWRNGLAVKHGAGVDIDVDRLVGIGLIDTALAAAPSAADASALGVVRDRLAAGDVEPVLASPRPVRAGAAGTAVLDDHRDDDRSTDLRGRSDEPDELDALFWRTGMRGPYATLARPLRLDVDAERARFSAWYEFFPRSTIAPAAGHATLRDAIERVDDVAAMGFDVLYLPPIHPIGSSHRKGPDNSAIAGPDDPGSPWAIGGAAGGHLAVHPALGTLDDVVALAARCAEHDIALALDLAFQCSPDHPWVTEHPQWFAHRPDGTIQYAENPPKKYQDIYPLDFETADWANLWRALGEVVRFWIDRGVDVFRVDNPHTKAFAFWEWMIADVRADHPQVIFLAEAFTRPRVMERLAKIGFNQSYTYFTWRQSSWELREYGTELAADTVEFFRPNFWPATPDILTEQLQTGGRAMFESRAFLAATISPSWGIYGPAYELMEHHARRGVEEYASNEKYELRRWELDRASIAAHLAALNEVRRAHPALAHLRTLRFHHSDNPAVLCWSKTDPNGIGFPLLMVANVDAHRHQHAVLDIDLAPLGLPYGVDYDVADQLSGTRHHWSGSHNRLDLAPGQGVVFTVRQR